MGVGPGMVWGELTNTVHAGVKACVSEADDAC